jgi:hypothetical protein
MSEQKKPRKRGNGKGFDAWWEERSLVEKILVGIGFGILGLGFIAFFGWVVMLLWNWLMPDIFGLKQIGYWQAWGLLILCTILFKGMHFHDDNRRTDKKRRRELRRYLRDEQPANGKEQAESPESGEA